MDWLIILSIVIPSVVAAIGASLTIWYHHRSRSKDQVIRNKENFLDEIYDWANELVGHSRAYSVITEANVGLSSEVSVQLILEVEDLVGRGKQLVKASEGFSNVPTESLKKLLDFFERKSRLLNNSNTRVELQHLCNDLKGQILSLEYG